MKKIILLIICLLFNVSQVLAWETPVLRKPMLTPIGDTSVQDTIKKMPPGLTSYKDFSHSRSGDIGSLNADFVFGSPIPTFTSTSGTFTITGGGIQITTANDEVLKYAILNNRTAAQETIVIKFTPTGDFANDGVLRMLLMEDGFRREISKDYLTKEMRFWSNVADDISVYAEATTDVKSDILYSVGCVCLNPNVQNIYLNGVLEGTNSNNWTLETLGTYFYIGCHPIGANQLNGIIHSIAFFNRALSASEVATATNLMK